MYMNMLKNLGSNLSDTLKKKNWDNEYVDFHSFLPDFPEKVKKNSLGNSEFGKPSHRNRRQGKKITHF